ncbi:MAG: hypothetical protein HYS13_23845 [Planctomycetia bacterium]|nr:hypothetical protein [Planctomycetia bacterium]
MRKWIWTALLVVPLAGLGSLIYAAVAGPERTKAGPEGYICPLTGEELPCPKCCPLNKGE